MNKLKFFILLISSLTLAACSSNDDKDDDVNPNQPSVGLTAENEVTDGSGNVYKVGFEQVSGNNQNPFVEKLDAGGTRVWKVSHETTGVDGRAVLVTLDANDNPWVTFTVDGGSNDNNYINKKEIENNAFDNVFQSGYGSGGGAKVSIIARLNPNNGKIVKGTFMTARLNSGNTNTLNISKIGFENGNFAFEISSAAWPPGTGKSYKRFPNITDADRVNNRFKIYYEIKTDLSEILEATLLKD